MGMLKKGICSIVVILVVFVLIIAILPFFLNRYTDEGVLQLDGLNKPVKVLRDEKGMAYIYAENMHDGIMAQGFVAAQDRLFQMELMRLISAGRISELAGEGGRDLDIQMRTIGFYRNAKKHAKLLDEKNRIFFQNYVDGINAYIKNRKKTHHLEFKLAGINPEEWTIEQSLAVIYYMGWNSAGNLTSEIISQMLVDKLGIERASEIFPLNINPDDNPLQQKTKNIQETGHKKLNLALETRLSSLMNDKRFRIGSNNWAVGPNFSSKGRPIVADDPHLDARILPGPWYPCGIILPDLRAVGVMVPGIPGMVIGRTDHFAIGVTNAYGDAQDLFIETIDPDDPNRYLEGEKSFPFQQAEETLRIRDKDAPGSFREEKIKIKFTRRGPVVSNVLPGLKTDKVMTLRWTAFESMRHSIGLEDLLRAKTVWDVRESLSYINVIMLNMVFADTQGNIGWHVTSRLPIRPNGGGDLPFVVKDSQDAWGGWIPYDEMPNSYNPEKGWVGTCNHMTVNQKYPYYYSSNVATSWRYRRLKQLLGDPAFKTQEDHWEFQLDTMNLMAKEIAPIITKILLNNEQTKKMGKVLAGWDFKDDVDKAGATIFHAVYDRFTYLVFEDELGKVLTETMLDWWDYWQERLKMMILEGSSSWFDDVRTADRVETMDDLFLKAASEADEELKRQFGDNPEKWTWGKVHKIEFVSPIRRKGFGKGLAGGGVYSFPGSGDTLCRGIYDFNNPYYVTVSASLRMVADLADEDKILAVIPGGVAGRIFHPHYKDQIDSFIKGDKEYWWFSDKAIDEHMKTSLVLNPE